MYNMASQPRRTDSLVDYKSLEGARLAHLILDMGFGGAEQLVQNITIAMTQQGAQCHIICFDAISGNTEPLAQHGISIELIKRKQTSFDALACLRLLRRVKALGIQLVHAHDMSSLAYATVAGLVLRIPVIMTEHSRHYIEARRIRRLEKRLLCLGVNKLVAVAPELARASVQRDGIAPGKVTVIENGVAATRFDSANGHAFRAELGVASGELLVGMVGRLETIKGPEVLLEAFADLSGQFPEARLAYIGEGSLGDVLRAQAEALGISGRVHFPGARSDIPEVMAGLDVLALPSLSEGLPFALLEGMAAGRAVVATTVGRIPEIVQPAQSPENGLLVPPGNPLALSQALSNLLGNETLRLRLGRTARSSVARRYDQQAMCRHYQAVYAQALSKRVGP
jgi:glycosyltransferase involved in cell wall biosynthesis